MVITRISPCFKKCDWLETAQVSNHFSEETSFADFSHQVTLIPLCKKIVSLEIKYRRAEIGI